MKDINVFEINKDVFDGIDVKKIMQEIQKKADRLPEPDFNELEIIDKKAYKTTEEHLEDLRASSFVTTKFVVPTGNFLVKIIKRFFRKMTFWYVEPSILAHSNFNIKIVDVLEAYEVEVAELKEKVDQLKNKQKIADEE